MAKMKRKANSWQAQARVQIESAVLARSGSKSTKPNQHGGTRSVARQLFELRSRQVRVEGLAAKRSQMREQERRRSLEKSAKERVISRYVQRRQKIEQSCCPKPKVPSLFSMCAAQLVAMLDYIDEDDISLLSMLPLSIKTEFLAQAKEHALQFGESILTNDLLKGLIEFQIECLDISHSAITNDFVELLRPVVRPFELVDSWERLTDIHVEGLVNLHTLDLSFCPFLTEDVLAQLRETCPGLTSLAIAGNFNEVDGSTKVLASLSEFSTLRFLNLSCCFWVSLELFFHSNFINSTSLSNASSLRLISVEECNEITCFAARLPLYKSDATALNNFSLGYIDEIASSLPMESTSSHFFFSRALEYFHEIGELRWIILVHSLNPDCKRVLRLVTSYSDYSDDETSVLT